MKSNRFVRFVILAMCLALAVVWSAGVTALALTVTDTTVADSDAQFTYGYTTALVKNNSGIFHSDKITSGAGSSGFTKTTNTDGSVTLKLTAVSTYYYKSWGIGYDAKDAVATLTLTNSTNNLLAVSYKDSSIPGLTGTGTFYINPNSTFDMVVTADTSANNASSIVATGSITITGIEAAVLESVNFYSSQYGSYTWTVGTASGSVELGTETISSSVAGTASAYANTALTATLTDVANDGYKFVGWVSDGKVLSTGTTLSITTTGAMNIYPLFVAEAAKAIFTVNGVDHYYWLTAMNSSISTGQPAILTGHYTLPSTLLENGMRTAVEGMVSGTDGALTYAVPAGAKLVVPRKAGDAGIFTSNISSVTSADSNRYAYATLTVPTGSKLTVMGAMNVNGIPREADSSGISTVSGAFGHVYLQEGGVLSIGSGGSLYCYGYITGDGYVEALNRSYVYELMQVGDWKGGQATLDWLTDSSGHTNPVFVISQFFAQNIEADYYIYSGASESVSVYLQSFGTTSAVFVGSNGLFNITSGHVLRSYDPATDRVTYSALESAQVLVQSILLPYSYSIFSGTMNSGDYILGIPNNMTLCAADTSEVTLANRFRLLPGSEIIIEEEAKLNVNANLYLYGTTDWLSSPFCDSGYFSRTDYIASIDGNIYRTVDMSTPSAKLHIDCTMTISSSGGVFSSALAGDYFDPGKAITGNGKIINNSSASAHVITEYNRTTNDSGDPISAPIEMPFEVAVARLAGVTTSDMEYDNLATTTYYGWNDYWYTTSLTVDGEVAQIAAAQGNVVKDNGDGTYTLYATTKARLSLNSGYAAYQNGNKLATVFDNYTRTIAFVTTDLTNPITITADETAPVEVTVNVVSTCLDGCTGKKADSFAISVIPGTTVNGFYSDEACNNPVTSITEATTVYMKAQVRVDWCDTSMPDSYFTTLEEAIAQAVHSGDIIHLLGCVENERTLGIPLNTSLSVHLHGHTLTYNRVLLYVHGVLDLYLEGGTIVNNTAADKISELTAIYNITGGTLRLYTDGGTLKWWAPEADTDPETDVYTFTWNSQSIYTPLYNYAGATADIDMTGGGTIEVNYPTALYYGYKNEDKDTIIRNRLYAIYNVGNMTITGNGDGTGIITGNTYAAAATAESLVGFKKSPTLVSGTGGTIYAQTTLFTYGDDADLTLNGVTVSNTATAGSSAVTAVVVAHRAKNLAIRNSTITGAGSDPYCLLNVGSTVSELKNTTISGGRGGIYNLNNRQTLYDENGESCAYVPYYVGRIELIEDCTISGHYYGIFNRAQIGTITGNSVIKETRNTSGSSTTPCAIYNCYMAAGTDTRIQYWTTTYNADGSSRKTYTYRVEDRPTIEAITGNTQVVGQRYGIAVYNLGYIVEISGNAVISSGSKYSSLESVYYYGSLYNNGGVIDTIGGNATIITGTVTDNEDGTQTLTTSGVRAILQMGQRELTRIQYFDANGVQTKQESTYQLATIDKISGSTAEGDPGVRIYGVNYTILNFGNINTISGKTTIYGSSTSSIAIYNAGLKEDLYVHETTADDGTVTTKNIFVPGYTATTTPYTDGTAGTAEYAYTPSHIGIIGDNGSDVLIDAGGYTICLTTSSTLDHLGYGNGKVTVIQRTNTEKSYYAVGVQNNADLGIIGGGESVVTITGNATSTSAGAIKVSGGGTIDVIASGDITGYNAIYSTANINNVGSNGNTLNLTATYRVMNLTTGSVTKYIAPVGSVVNCTNTSQMGIATYNTAVIYELGAGGTLNITTQGNGIYIRNENSTEPYVKVIGNGGQITITSTGGNGIRIGDAKRGLNMGTIGTNGAEITITAKTYGIDILGLDATNVTIVGTIGEDSTITIKSATRGVNVRAYSEVSTIGAGGTIDITATQHGIYVAANSVVDKISRDVEIISAQYGIYNLGTIDELADGLVVISNGSTDYYTVYNEGTISMMSGGDYFHASGRDYIISNTGTINYPTPCHGLSPEGDTRTVTLNNGDQKECYYIVVAYHTWNGDCVCDECSIFRFYATNVNLGNDLDLMFAIPSKLFSNKTEEQLVQYYAEFILEDGTKKQLAFADWKKLGINGTNSVEGDGYYVVYYSFAAKQMSDVVTVTIYDGEGNAVTITKSDSIQAYAMRILADAEEENLVNLKTVIVDMLNYGAACQTHFAYNTTNPANSQLSETQKEYATQTMKNVTNTVEGTPTFWAGANLVTDSNIQFAVAFKGLSEDATVSYSFTGHKNNEVTGEVTLSAMKESVTDSETYYYFMIPELVVADARCAIQITVTSGGQTVTWTESIEAYIARNADSDDAYTAFMKFADSSYEYLHNKEV